MFPVDCVGVSCAVLVIFRTYIPKLCRMRKLCGPFLLIPPYQCHVLEIVSDPDHCQQKVSSAWGDFTFAGDTMRLAIRSNSFWGIFWRCVFRCVPQEYVVFWLPAVWKCEMSDLYSVCGTNMNVCALW